MSSLFYLTVKDCHYLSAVCLINTVYVTRKPKGAAGSENSSCHIKMTLYLLTTHRYLAEGKYIILSCLLMRTHVCFFVCLFGTNALVWACMFLCMSVRIFMFTHTCVRHTLIARVRSATEKYRQDHKCSYVRLLPLTFCDVLTYLVTMSCLRPIGIIFLNSFLFFHSSVAFFLVSLLSFLMTLS